MVLAKKVWCTFRISRRTGVYTYLDQWFYIELASFENLLVAAHFGWICVIPKDAQFISYTCIQGTKCHIVLSVQHGKCCIMKSPNKNYFIFSIHFSIQAELFIFRLKKPICSSEKMEVRLPSWRACHGLEKNR